MRQLIIQLFAMLGLASLSGWPSWAQYPTKTVKIMVSSSTGSSPDLSARVLAQKLSDQWRQPVVVENVPGAGGNLAAERVAKSQPDGYTLLYASAGVLYFNKSLYPKLSYDIDKDLTPVIRIARTPNLLVVPKSSPHQNVQQLLQFARAQPGALRYGSGGSGSSMHVLAEVLAEKTQVRFEHIPYKSSSQMLQELMAGQIDFAIHNIAVVMPFVKSGKLKALAVTSENRFFLVPAVPTLKEAGWPVVWEGGSGLMAPASTPAEVVQQLANDVEKLLNRQDVQHTMQSNGLEAAPLKTNEFKRSIKEVSSAWHDVLIKTQAKVD
jgi:tripartite-type tricarboxylate transporter receptor subunit TctC